MSETVWINRSDLTDMMVNEEASALLPENAVRLRIDSFSVTANNVTYAVAGDGFGYWNFFPAGEGYGVVPMWGHATVEASNHPELAIGERVYGYLPMGTHLDIMPGKVTPGGFIDAAAHRQPMSPIYNQYSRLAADPEHDPAKEKERMIFAPLFKTGWLIEYMLRSNDWFGAQNLVMTSASSKTSMGLASCAAQSSPHIRRIGMTSSGNVEFVKATGLYDAVMAYDDVAALPQTESISVDFAGNSALLANIHRTLGDHLKYSCLVGATHVDARGGAGGGTRDITNPAPILFFAPDHAVAAIKELGPKAFGEAVAKSWHTFLSAVEGGVTMEERSGLLEAINAFQAIYKNTADPSVGIVVRP
ncbi:DUF2855 family protein [Sphingorhabdus arenilitoris]|uniref:DUF2855 family protein n=1 Tax=Sphingorhabdus arenilitoris TaxID=1490041 RepID=A0ABV8RJZ4_9SPHN